MVKFRILLSVLVVLLFNNSCTYLGFNVEKEIKYCLEKSRLTLEEIDEFDQFPTSISKQEYEWNLSRPSGWSSGFWPGILWYCYEYSQNEFWKVNAEKFTKGLESNRNRLYKTHDLGFIMYNSYGHGYRLTGNPEYKKILLESADSLVSLYNPKVGTFLSWPWMLRKAGWSHNSFLGTMVNLNLVFWAGKNGRPEYTGFAVSHAKKTIQDAVRDDFSAYQVVLYDDESGEVSDKFTYRGLSSESTWSRGQAYAIYGFAQAYRETGLEIFLETALNMTDYFLKNLPDDYVPYWDFNVEKKEQKVKDASAGAIFASAVFELCGLVDDSAERKKLFRAGKKILQSLSSANYKSGNKNRAFILHSTEYFSSERLVDASLIFADYYYLESLLRYQNIKKEFF